KNSAAGVATDEQGNFSITVPGDGAILVFSYVSYTPQEIPVAGQTSISVVLEPESHALSEVVVVGYGTMEKREVTSAISHVSADELATVAANDPLMRIQGKVA